MKFTPEKYAIEDKAQQPFIDVEEIEMFLAEAKPSKQRILEIIDKSIAKNRLNLAEVATLLNAEDPESVQLIKDGAQRLKKEVYGNRIVLFAPLYVGNKCTNNCQYCGFRASNKEVKRATLDKQELIAEVKSLERSGQKRLILVYGEHPKYDAEYIAESVKTVYGVKEDNGEIRRVNINAAPMSVAGFKTVKEAGIGTFQVFQETYHPEFYKKFHPSGQKANYDYRLVSLDRAQEAGLDDVGIGALFGLYDWKFEVMSLVRHTSHLEAVYNVGPHTISFPRLQEAHSVELDKDYTVNDEDFMRLIAILRLAVPYTGLILTARENAELRAEAISYGVSQIDGGTKIEIGAYATQDEEQHIDKEQFRINDERSLNEIIDELIGNKFLPSFCTSCYRKGRTGEHFMEFSVPGFIKRFCSPNAILTLAEYLEDYAPEKTVIEGWELIEKEIIDLNDHADVPEIRKRLERIKAGERDLCF